MTWVFPIPGDFPGQFGTILPTSGTIGPRRLPATPAVSTEPVIVRWGAIMHDVHRAAGTPVFLDQRGRRRRWLVGYGLAVAVLCILYVVLLVAGLAADPVRPGGAESVEPPAERAPRPAEVGVSR